MSAITNEHKHSQQGHTLIELLISISISGLLLLAVFELYSSANQAWHITTRQFQFMQNYIKTVHCLSQDVRHSNAIEKVTKNYIRLAAEQEKIRYKIKYTPKTVTIIREVQSEPGKKWIQQPRFPLSEFSTEYLKFESVKFKKINDVQIAFLIDEHEKTFRTALTRRNQF
ncbi:prepilin-type N-terminal cleavage/methylation domain-containing protein [candidate division KSB1 bacterium]|nr:prepilin-type N-terminal cleavage/methylation domain-containing protein [candidate division KSB1 bacterium]